MIGLIYPGINRLDYDFAANGGVFPAHMESLNDARIARWLEQVIQVLPVAPRPEGYNPLGQKNLDPKWIARLGQTGKDCFEAIRRRDLRALGASLNECMVCWEKLLPHTVRHPTLKCGPLGPAAGLPVVLCRGDVLGLRRGLLVGGVKGAGAGRVHREGAGQRPGQGDDSRRMTADSRPKQVVVTGAFDDLRSRQIRFLEEAARLGEVTALLWADELVRQFEGKGPKFPEAERAYFLRAIRFVQPSPDGHPAVRWQCAAAGSRSLKPEVWAVPGVRKGNAAQASLLRGARPAIPRAAGRGPARVSRASA